MYRSGNINFKNPLLMHADANGRAKTAYSDTQNIKTDSVSPVYFRLRETGRGNGIQTFNLNKGTNYGTATDFIDSNNFWHNVNANKDEYATDAHWGAEMTYDYFWTKHNRNSMIMRVSCLRVIYITVQITQMHLGMERA
jgi:bacillolysin